MNRVLIDTDILSYYFKGDEIVIGNFKKYLEKNDMTLVTNNENHFGRIPGLRIENWKR